MRKNTNILSPLWDFLKNLKSRPLDPQVNTSVTNNSPSSIQNAAIFFSRLNIFLFSKMPSIMLRFLNERVPNALDLLVNNLDLQPICELLYRMFALKEGGDDMMLEWLKNGDFYDKLASQLNPFKGPDLHVATYQFVLGLFALPFPDQLPRDRVIFPFLSHSWLIRLLENIFVEIEAGSDFSIDFVEESKQSSLINGLSILTSILEASHDIKKQFAADAFISAINDNFETFFDLLQRPCGIELSLTSGRIEAFGRVRLCAAQLFTEILSSLPETRQCESFVKGFRDVKLVPIMLDAFFHYKQNSLLHEIVVHMIEIIFESPVHFEVLIQQCLQDYSLRQRILKFQKENDSHVQRPRGNRLPLMCHLTQIAECIIKWETNANQLTRCSFAVSNVQDEPWREYKNMTFKETQFKDSKVLGGIRPPVALDEMISSSEVDSEDEFLNYNSVFRSGDEEKMARYFCQQIIGNLPEQLLYVDESEDSEDLDEDGSDSFEFVFHQSTQPSTMQQPQKQRFKHKNVKSIEIPILMTQDDFDEEMFDDSFTSSLLSLSESETESESEDEDEEDANNDGDYEM